MESFEEIQRVEELKREVKSTVEKDATEKANYRYRIICKKRGGKFKISEKQFIDELESIWVAAEFSGAERILRCIESDPELNSRDLCIGEVQIFIMDLYKILRRRWNLKEHFDLSDLIDGKYSTKAKEHVL